MTDNQSNESATQAPLAVVTAFQGEVMYAPGGDQSRPLSGGQSIQLGDTLETLGASAVLLKFANGAVVNIGHDRLLTLDQALLDRLEALLEEQRTAEDAEPVNFDLLAEALAEGRSIEDLLPPAAAGEEGPGDSAAAGIPGIRIFYTNEQVTPDSGFETTGFGFSNTVVADELSGRDSNDLLAAQNTAPEITGAALSVGEMDANVDLGVNAPTDADGDSLTITVTGLPSQGGMTLADGTPVAVGQVLTATQFEGLQYSGPGAAYDGDDVGGFTYSVSDGTETVNGAVDISVIATDDAPVVDTATVAVVETAANVGLGLSAPTDVDSAELTITVTGLPTVGTVKLADGSPVVSGQVLSAEALEGLQFDGPGPAYDGVDAGVLTYSVSDGNSSITGSVSFQVTAVNDAPSASLSINDMAENGVAVGDVIATIGAVDVDGDSLTYTLANDPNGYFEISGTDVLLTQAGVDAINSDALGLTNLPVTVQVSDGTNTASATGISNIARFNDPPLAADAAGNTEENTVLVDTVPAATDVDGTVDPNGYALVTDVPAGTLVFNADGSYTFTPGSDFDDLAAGASRDISFTYTATDNNGGVSAPATVTITVTGTNDAPVASAATASTEENTVLNGAVPAATDIDGTIDPNGYALVADVATGALVFNADGSYTFTPGTDFDDLAPGASRDISFTYTATDNNGGVSAPATVTITVTGTNDAPVASAATASTEENTVLNGVVPAATDIDGTIDPNGYALVTDVSAGTLVFNADGSYTFTPGSDFDDLAPGASRDISFTYTATDNNGGVSAPATVTITVTGTNDAPVASAATASTEENTVLNSVVPAATDIDGTIDPNGYALVTDVSAGTLVFNADGSYTFTPGSDFDDLAPGASRDISFTYTATDNNGGVSAPATVTITVTGTNDAPVASAATASTEENTVLNSAVPAATDIDGTIDPNGYALVTDVSAGTLVFNADGSYTFTPGSDFDDLPPGASRDISFTYTATDNNGGVSAPATVTITVTGTNDAPVASAATASTEENTVLNGAVPAATDIDGTIDPNGYALVTDVTAGALVFNADGSYTFTPGSDFDDLPPGASRDISFTYTATDNNGGVSAPATVTITVTGTNDAPVASAATASTEENTVLNSAVPAATDVDGTIDPNGYALVTDVSAGTLVFNADGSYTFTPGTDFDDLAPGASRDISFTYTATDNNGGVSTPATVTITVTGTNDAPIASAAAASTDEDTVLNGAVPAATDVDGTVNATGYALVTGVTAGTLVFNADGSYTFTPGSDFDDLAPGASRDISFTYTATDNNGTVSAPATVTITVTGVNDAPVAVVDSYSASEGDSLTIDAAAGVLNNDTDAEGSALSVTEVAVDTSGAGAVAVDGVTSIATALGGSVIVNADGSFSYTAPASLDHSAADVLQDSFTYRTSDGADTSDWTTVIIDVADTAPIAVDDSDSVGLGATAIGNVITGPGGTDTTGADPVQITNVSYNGTPVSSVFDSNTGTWTITTDSGVLSMDQSGNYSYLSTLFSDIVSGPDAADWDAVGVGYYGFDNDGGGDTTPFVGDDISGGLDLTKLNASASDIVTFDDATGTNQDGLGVEGGNGDGKLGPGEYLVLDLGADSSLAIVDFTSIRPIESADWYAFDENGNLVTNGTVTGDPSQAAAANIDAGLDTIRYIVVEADTSLIRVNGLRFGVDNSSLPLDEFTYQLSDIDGDTDTAVLSVQHELLGGNADAAEVSEAGLPTGTEAGVAATRASGNLLDNDTGISAVTQITEVAGQTDSDGDGIITVTTPLGVLTVYTAAVAGQQAGDYEYVLQTSATEGVNDLEAFSYTVENTLTGQSASSTLSVNILDDAPQGSDINVTLDDGSGASSFNLVIVLDRSGSMNSDENGRTRMDIAKDALEQLFDAYDKAGNVNVQIVDFADAANKSAWYVDDINGAVDYLQAVATGGETAYDAALNEVMSGYAPPPADKTVVYFVSDGEPTAGNEIDAAGEASWIQFLQDNNVDLSFGIGIGDAGLGSLQPVAYPDDDGNNDGNEDYAITLSNAEDLASTLLSTIDGGVVAGDISILAGTGGDGVITGADGGYINAITIDGVVYTYTPGDAQSTTINTPKGAFLDFNFVTGEYRYYVSLDQTIQGEQETITFSVVDGDGDTTTIDMVVTLDYVANLDANRDIILTNVDEGPVIEIPGLALLNNDSGNGAQQVTGVSNANGGTVAFAGGVVSFTKAEAGEIVENPADSETNELNGSLATATEIDRSEFGFVGAADAANVADATMLSVKYSGQLVAAGGKDQDWIKISLDRGERVIFDIDNGHANGGADVSVDTVIFLYDSAGNLISSNDDAPASLGGAGSANARDAYLEYTAEADGEYYLQITSFSNADSGDYDLWVSVDRLAGFDYTISEGGDQDTARADVVVVNGNTLTGTGEDEILVAGNGADTLVAGAGDDTLIGDAGNDILFGGDGDDILLGGSGADSLSGGSGADVFAWAAADADGGTDTIVDFSTADGDVLDLRDLLNGEEDPEASLADFIQLTLGDFDADGAADDTRVVIDADGGDFTSPDQTIVVQNSDLTFGLTDNNQILDNLLNNNNLSVDQ
ncbi:retention module-containing protein [Exilibacterium tricleocarpae]|uniref:Retention module-containing protein n=1 Tax=Exilibacterium tricleocarpae TaxID=2591008 RepID=A0A545U700_9GAMM|nr:retention module-containing protein [Exilibacterium tricleocarpae]TQV85242.1 retention module-containing protein [Exilibacterium tricleocarpae]